MTEIITEIAAFIFDMDGVLTDTVRYHYLSWKKLSLEENIPFTEGDNEKLLGLSRSDSLEIFLKGRKISDSKKAELLQRKNDYFLELIDGFSKDNLLPGVENLLRQLNNRRFKMAVASSSRNARMIIKKLGIDIFFNSIIDGNQVVKAKPAPDLFLMTAEKLDVNPNKCIVVEDSAAGVESALQAGMKIIGIGPKKRLARATWIFDSIAKINLEKL